MSLIERRNRERGAPLGEPQREHLESEILGTYREMPGLSLHPAQAVRLFGLKSKTCQVVLDDLVVRGVLRRSSDGQYLLR